MCQVNQDQGGSNTARLKSLNWRWNKIHCVPSAPLPLSLNGRSVEYWLKEFNNFSRRIYFSTIQTTHCVHQPSPKRGGHDFWFKGGRKKVKQSDEINLVINESELSDWHSWTLARMPSPVLMRYWDTSLWCFQILHITAPSAVCCQTGSPDLWLISLYDFPRWHSHSTPVIWQSMGGKRLTWL